MTATIRTPVQIIALEGIDGAGKSTIHPRLLTALRAVAKGSAVLGAAEFDSPIGSTLRTSLPELSWQEKTLLFCADRIITLRRIEAQVRWLKSSDSFLVLWDRYVASAMAYRFADAAAASLDAAEVLRFVSLVNGVCPAPSLTVFLDIPPSASVNRQEDVTNEDFLHLVQLGYERYFAQSDQPVVTVDGTMPPEHVVNAALSGIAQAGII